MQDVIVIDTNIINKQFFLQRPEFVLLCDSMEVLGHEIHLPMVVVDELVKHYREAFENRIACLNSQIKEYNKLLWQNELNIQSRSIDEQVTLYKQYLLELIKSKGIILDPYPQITHEELAKRWTRNAKPFKHTEKNDGYRDALIWETIKELVPKLNDNQELVFITNNTTDFAEGEHKVLNFDLQKELESLREGVYTSLYTSLSEYNKFNVESEMERRRPTGDLKQTLLDTGFFKNLDLKKEIELYLSREADNIAQEIENADIPVIPPYIYYLYARWYENILINDCAVQLSVKEDAFYVELNISSSTNAVFVMLHEDMKKYQGNEPRIEMWDWDGSGKVLSASDDFATTWKVNFTISTDGKKIINRSHLLLDIRKENK